MRRLRPVLWTLKVLVLPIAATLAALYGLLLHLLRNAELRAAQRDRIDSLIEGDAEEHKRSKEKEREKEEEGKKIGATFAALPRASKSDLGMVRCSRDGRVVAAVSAEGVVLVWPDAAYEPSGSISPGRRSSDGGSGCEASNSNSNGNGSPRAAPMIIPVPVAGVQVSCLCIDAKGKKIAVAGGEVVQVWDVSHGCPIPGRRLLNTPSISTTELGSAVRDVKFLEGKRKETSTYLTSKSRPPTRSPPKPVLLVAYDNGSVLEWDSDTGDLLAQIVPRYPGSQATLSVRETVVSVAFCHPDGHIDVYHRLLDKDNVASYSPTMSLRVLGVIALDIHEWSLGPLLATLTADGHVAVWGTGGKPIVEMDLGLPPLDDSESFTAPTIHGRIALLPTPSTPLPCRQCGLPPPCSFTIAFSSPSPSCVSSNHTPTVYIRRASVLYQPGRCSCQPISIASTLAGPRVISFGFPSGVRVVSGLGIGGVNGGTMANEFPVPIHSLRRASSSYGRHSFESSSSASAEDSSVDSPPRDYSTFLAPPTHDGNGLNSNENGQKHVGSDVRWEQHTIEESCERGQWETVGTRVMGIRRKSRVKSSNEHSSAPAAASSDQLPSAVLERWEVWQVDTTSADMPRGASTLSRLSEGSESHPVASQSEAAAESQRSPHISRILRLGRAANMQSLAPSPSPSGGRKQINSHEISFPRLPFTRVSSASGSHDKFFASLGNTIGVLRLDLPGPSSRQRP